MEVITIEVARIHANPDNPRFEAGDVTDLAVSIREEGLKQPLLVRPYDIRDGEEHYLLEDGFRRLTAARQVLTFVPVIVQHVHPDENLLVRTLVTGLITSVHNKPLTPMEKARAYGRLRDEVRLTHTEIAKKVGVSSTTVTNHLALLDLAPAAQERLDKRTLKVEDALRAVRDHRAKVRKGQGKQPIEVGWEPDHFTAKHPLARKARIICNAREHNNRRRFEGVACGQCFEEAIRQDQTAILQAAWLDAQRDGYNPVFMPPFQTADGAMRNGTIGNVF